MPSLAHEKEKAHMKMKRLIPLVLSFTLAVSSSVGVYAQSMEQKVEAFSAPYIEGEVIACIKGELGSLNTRSRSRGFEITPLMELTDDSIHTYNTDMANQQGETLVLVKADQDTESLIKELEEMPTVEFAEPNYEVELYDTPEDTYYEYQWGIENRMETEQAVDANIAEAWESTASSSDVPVVAVLDSGVDYRHPDLKNVMWDDGLNYPLLTEMGGGTYGFNTCDGPEMTNDPMDTWIGHGTHCAGIIAAQWNNEEGTAGVTSEAEIMAVKFLGGSKGGIADALKGYAYIQAAKESGVNVVAINNSWGVSNYNGITPRSISTATEVLGELGVVSCFAAGNSSTDNDLNVGSNPISPYVITVGALESQGHSAPFSCYGQRRVDVFAPGAQILAPITTDTSVVPLTEHQMVPQYLPQLMERAQSYYYEDFEDGNPSLTLRVLNENGEVIEDNQTSLAHGYMSERGTQISLEAVEEGEVFYIEMSFSKSDFIGLEEIAEGQAVYFAFQGGMDSSCNMQSMPIYYQDEDGEWQILMTSQVMDGNQVPARFRIADYNWNQSSQELKDSSFLQDEGDTVTLRMKAQMNGKQSGSTFYLDDIGFGKEAVPYYYSDGTSMATPMVTGIVALLASKYDDAAEICARVKGGVNREDAIGLEELSVSGGFVDAAASFDDQKVVPVLNDLVIEGKTATVTGYFFGNEQGSIEVGKEKAAITSWSNRTITFALPDIAFDVDEIRITTIDGRFGRNFFEFQSPTKGYKDLSVPNIAYGNVYGYERSSDDVIPVGIAAAGGKILILGQMADNEQTVIEEYDIQNDTWSQVPLPDNRLNEKPQFPFFSMTGGLSKIYLSYETREGHKLGIYDTISGTWFNADSLLNGTETLVVYQDKLLAIGGEKTSDDLILEETYKSVQVIDPYTGQTIDRLPDLPEGRSAAHAYASGDTLVVYGGYDSAVLDVFGYAATEYSNTMVYDGNKWTNNKEDQFLSAQNTEFDRMQTLGYAIGAVDGGLIVTGPVHNLGDKDMVDTWNFNASTSAWSKNQEVLYNHIKTTNNIGVSYDGNFYALGNTGENKHPLVFRSIPVQYTPPTKDPESDHVIKVPVIYEYEGTMVAREDVILTEGDHTVSASNKLAENYGFVLKDMAENEQRVNVVTNKETGELEASIEAIHFNVVPDIDPAEYGFQVTYIDGTGNTVPGGGRITFDKVGPYSREKIPMPYGYQAINIPAHPGNEWLNPTSLEFVDGKWTVTNPDVVIEVEKQASVEVIFKLEDGTILEGSYTDYYGDIGAGLVLVHVPEGYELIDKRDYYAVDVTRDTSGALRTNITEAIFLVRKAETVAPENPSDPADPSGPHDSSAETPVTPSNNDTPQTGDDSHIALMTLLMLASCGIVFTLKMKQRRKQEN